MTLIANPGHCEQIADLTDCQVLHPLLWRADDGLGTMRLSQRRTRVASPGSARPGPEFEFDQRIARSAPAKLHLAQLVGR